MTRTTTNSKQVGLDGILIEDERQTSIDDFPIGDDYTEKAHAQGIGDFRGFDPETAE